MAQATICQICGDTGYSHLLVHCVQCQIIAAHRYCVKDPSIFFKGIVDWACENCIPRKIVFGLSCRKKIEEEANLQKTTETNREKNTGRPIAGELIGPLKGATQVTSSISHLDLKNKEITRIKQVDLSGKGNDTSKHTQGMPQDGTSPEQLKQSLDDKVCGSDVLSRGKESREINASATGQGGQNGSMPQHEDRCFLPSNDATQKHPQKRKRSAAVKKDTSGVVSVGTRSKDKNSVNDLKQGNFEPVHDTSQEETDMNSSDPLGDQHLNLGKNVGPLGQKEKDPASESTSSTGENIHGYSGLGKKEKYEAPLLSKKKDHIVESTSIAEESVGAVSDLDKLHNDEELSDEIHSKLKEHLDSFKNIAASDCSGHQKSDVVEETGTDFVLDQDDDVQSHHDTSRAPRKRRRLIIEMELSDEEPTLVVSNHSPRVSDVGEDHSLKSNYGGLVKLGCIESDGPQPSPKLDSPLCVQESSRVISNHPFAQPSLYSTAQPVIETAWRGHCSINEGKHPMSLELEAHVSCKAHGKVQGAASALPEFLNFGFVPKIHAWPTRFEKSPPTGDSIGLYFFPVDERSERVYRYLIDRMSEHGLILRCYINNLELLVFCSIELPLEERCFRKNYYLWGLFKTTKDRIMPNDVSDIHTGNAWSTLPSQYLNEVLDPFVELPQASALKSRKQAYDHDRQGRSSHREQEHRQVGDYSKRPKKPWISQDREFSRRESKFSSPAKERRHYDNGFKSRRKKLTKRWTKGHRDPVHDYDNRFARY